MTRFQIGRAFFRAIVLVKIILDECFVVNMEDEPKL